jgi:hypothetical protein
MVLGNVNVTTSATMASSRQRKPTRKPTSLAGDVPPTGPPSTLIRSTTERAPRQLTTKKRPQSLKKPKEKKNSLLL